AVLRRLRTTFAGAQSGDDLRCAAHAAHAGKNVGDGVGVAFGSAGGHSVFGEHLLKAALVGVAGRAFNAEGGSDAAKDNDREAAAVQLQFEIGAVECAPLTLEDNKIVGLAIELGNEFAPIGRKRP